MRIERSFGVLQGSPVRRRAVGVVLALAVALTLLCLDAPPIHAASSSVFFTNFDSGIPAEISGAGVATGVQGFAGLGPTGNQFGGQFLRNDTSSATTLTLTGLPPHTKLDINFLFAAIDSWDGSSGAFPSGDFFVVTVDGATSSTRASRTRTPALLRPLRRFWVVNSPGRRTWASRREAFTTTRPMTWA